MWITSMGNHGASGESAGVLVVLVLDRYSHVTSRDHFVNAPSQWEMTLHCNLVSHWLGAYTKWSLNIMQSHITWGSKSEFKWKSWLELFVDIPPPCDSSAEIEFFENYDSVIAVDALAPCISRSSAAMILTVPVDCRLNTLKPNLVFQEKILKSHLDI